MGDRVLDLEVDINGDEIFAMNKRLLSSCSGKIRRLFGKSICAAGRLKVIFNDFPGGPANFELIVRFCYDSRVDLNPTNISGIACAAHFMEMRELCEKSEKLLEEVGYWSWSEILAALRQCQEPLLPAAVSSGLIHRLLDSVVWRVATSCETSPCPSISSSDSFGFRLSCDTRSTESSHTRTYTYETRVEASQFSNGTAYRATWWFEDLAALDTTLIQMLVKLMASRNLDNGILSRFLFYYQKSRFASASTSLNDRIKSTETVVEMLHSLDTRSLSYKSLFGILRTAINMKLSHGCREKLEGMIGSQLDHATLDNLLVPSPAGASYLYDVDLVLRFLSLFHRDGSCCVSVSRLKKVSNLMDLYLAEVAPDPHLKPSKLLALIKAIPTAARDSFDLVYHAVNLYLQVHTGLSAEQKMKICLVLNYEKLSPEALSHLDQNKNFPSKSAIRSLVSQQQKLEGLLRDTHNGSSSIESPTCLGVRIDMARNADSKQMVRYAEKRLHFSDDNENLRAHLQGMEWRVLELEKVCQKMQHQMAKMMKSRISRRANAKSVPKLCS